MATWMVNAETGRRISPMLQNEESWHKFCASPMPMAALAMEANAVHFPITQDLVICAGHTWCEKYSPDGKFNQWRVFNLGDYRSAFIEPITMPNGKPILCEDNVVVPTLLPAWIIKSGSKPTKVIPNIYTEQSWIDYCKDTNMADNATAAFLAVEEDYMAGVICAGQLWCRKFAVTSIAIDNNYYPHFYGKYDEQWTVINLGDFRSLFVTKIDLPDTCLPIYAPHQQGDEEKYSYEIRNR